MSWRDVGSQEWMNRLIWMVAKAKEISFHEARFQVTRHMEELALEAKQKNLRSWEMWDKLGMLAYGASDVEFRSENMGHLA